MSKGLNRVISACIVVLLIANVMFNVCNVYGISPIYMIILSVFTLIYVSFYLYKNDKFYNDMVYIGTLHMDTSLTDGVFVQIEFDKDPEEFENASHVYLDVNPNANLTD